MARKFRCPFKSAVDSKKCLPARLSHQQDPFAAKCVVSLDRKSSLDLFGGHGFRNNASVRLNTMYTAAGCGMTRLTLLNLVNLPTKPKNGLVPIEFIASLKMSNKPGVPEVTAPYPPINPSEPPHPPSPPPTEPPAQAPTPG